VQVESENENRECLRETVYQVALVTKGSRPALIAC